MGYELRIEDDNTNTSLQVGRKRLNNRIQGTLRSIEDNIHFEISQSVTKIGRENCDINIIVSMKQSRNCLCLQIYYVLL